MIHSGESRNIPSLSEKSAAELYAEKTNPNESTTSELLGKALAVIHRGIPITPELQTQLYGKEIFPQPKFDFVDLAISDVLMRNPENLESIRAEFEHYNQRGLVKNGVLTHYGYLGMNFEQFATKVKAERKIELESQGAYDPGGELKPEFQDKSVTYKIETLFRGVSEVAQKEFQRVISENPQKPFLILNGHGGSRKGFLGKEWIVGDTNQDTAEALSVVLKKLDVSKYSAVILVACNEDQLVPPSYPNTTIFYAEQLLGMGSVLMKDANKPAKFTRKKSFFNR